MLWISKWAASWRSINGCPQIVPRKTPSMRRKRLVRIPELTEGVSGWDRNLSDNEKTVLRTKLPRWGPPRGVTDECGWRERQTEGLERGRKVMLWAPIMERVMKLADTRRWRWRTLSGWRDEIETLCWQWGHVWGGGRSRWQIDCTVIWAVLSLHHHVTGPALSRAAQAFRH